MFSPRTRSLGLAIVLLLMCVASLPAQNIVIPKSLALEHGLERSWFTQIGLDRARNRLVGLYYHSDALFALTSGGLVHAIDAETGRTLWSSQVGRPEHPSMGPAANEEYVAIVNGSLLFVLERASGKILWQRQVLGGPGAGPALTKDRVYVPLLDGRMLGYSLAKPKMHPWIYHSNGRALIQPVATPDSIFWPTDRGFLYVGRADDPGIRFRVESREEIANRPAYSKPYVYAASRDGFVYAAHELSGNQRWRFSAGAPINESPVAIGDHVFICADRAGMFCVSAKNGEEIWWAPQAARVLGASPDRVFATDKIGKLIILDIKSGARLSTMRIPNMSFSFVNSDTDRIYLATKSGLLQCLHEVSLPEPKYYSSRKPEDADTDEPIEQKGLEPEMPKGKPKPVDPFAPDAGGGADPFAPGADEKPPADDAADPFAGDAAGDDPFN